MPTHNSIRKEDAPCYDDLINYPRAKDKDEVRCVMCGNPPGANCVIPRQNKDVCKECDKSTWQHTATHAYFKWCKGCKKFIALACFIEKLDAAKCDKCRERGRQSYLLRKGKEERILTGMANQPTIGGGSSAGLVPQDGNGQEVHVPVLDSPGRNRLAIPQPPQLQPVSHQHQHHHDNEEAHQPVPPVSAHPPINSMSAAASGWGGFA